jgi:hypothetical protein
MSDITKSKIRAIQIPGWTKTVTTGLIARKSNMIRENSDLNEMENKNEMTAEEASESRSRDCTIMEYPAKHRGLGQSGLLLWQPF